MSEQEQNQTTETKGDSTIEVSPPFATPPSAEEPPALKDMTAEDLKKLKAKELEKLARQEKISAAGNKAEILARLTKVLMGTDAKFVPKKTICRMCGNPMTVLWTTNKVIDGVKYIQREMKCQGKHRHKYPILEKYE